MHVETDKIQVYASGRWDWGGGGWASSQEGEAGDKISLSTQSFQEMWGDDYCIIAVMSNDLSVQASRRCNFSNLVLVLGEKGETEQVNRL